MVENDPIKSAFSKVREDIDFLKESISQISHELSNLKSFISSQGYKADLPTNQQTDRQETPPHLLSKQTESQNTTDFKTHNSPLEAPKSPNINVSIGNNGVPTDRQTDQQTDTSTGNEGVQAQKFAQPDKNTCFRVEEAPGFAQPEEIPQKSQKIRKLDYIDEVANILNSLDSIKKDLRITFKKLTNQEMAVFSAIYQLEEQGFTVDYSLVSQKLNLSESSIRDYVQRIIKKEIPLSKYKENNKKIVLKISENLKKLANLQTIMHLRSL